MLSSQHRDVGVEFQHFILDASSVLCVSASIKTNLVAGNLTVWVQIPIIPIKIHFYQL